MDLHRSHPRSLARSPERYAESAAARTVEKDAYDSKQEAVAALRPRADKLIREILDHIEFAHRADSTPNRRRKCREWGIIM